MEPNGDVPALERVHADQSQLSGKPRSLSLTNAVCSVGGWRAGVSHRHVKINQTFRCEINTIHFNVMGLNGVSHESLRIIRSGTLEGRCHLRIMTVNLFVSITHDPRRSR